MANKGLWSIVQYPKSTDLERLLGVLRGSGAAVMWILHDKDKKEDGTPKPPHYHIAAGWSKGFPDWGKLLDMISQGGYEPPRVIDGQEQKPFKPKVSDCYPKSTPDKIQLYFLHWDDESKRAGKYEYPENELHIDEKWSPSDYVKAEDKRRNKSAEKAAEKADAFAAALKVAKENEIGEWADLCDYYAENSLDLGALVGVTYPVKSYLDSRRNIGKTSARCVKLLEDRVHELEARCKEYEAGDHPTIERLIVDLKQARQLRDQSERIAEQAEKRESAAICMIMQLYEHFGEYVSYTDILAALDRGVKYNDSGDDQKGK